MGSAVAWPASLFCRILTQLDDSYWDLFPAIVTRKYMCDIRTIGELRSRSIGNSPTALRNVLLEKHTRNWLIEQRRYMTDCFLHRYGVLALGCCCSL